MGVADAADSPLLSASIVVRTYNEERHLPELLRMVERQRAADSVREVVVVDSGSTDGTLEVARSFGCSIRHIARQDFSFGRSLNIGCEAATGDALIFISGHCIPTDDLWLSRLLEPLADGSVVWTYGRQIGNGDSHFSEQQIFAKYYAAASRIPQTGFFCNNANSALLRSVWQKERFDEDLTGLEDMQLAQRLTRQGMKLGYVGDAAVYHLHSETWGQVKRRFEREAIALQQIMPEVHVNFPDFLRYFVSSVMFDLGQALRQRQASRHAWPIVRYRLAQYWGSYQGNHSHRKLSRSKKEEYFYPR